MSLPKKLFWCETCDDKAQPPCFNSVGTPHEGHGVIHLIVTLTVAGPDDLVIRRDDDGNWPEFAITTLAAAFINNERGVGQHPDVVLDLLAAAEGGEE